MIPLVFVKPRSISHGSPEKQTNRMYIERKLYYKELAHAIMETDNSQDLQDELASWTPQRASSVVLVQV